MYHARRQLERDGARALGQRPEDLEDPPAGVLHLTGSVGLDL